MAADPKTSAGARLERKAFREYLRRQIKRADDGGATAAAHAMALVLDWVVARQSRYDKKPGGLGKKSRG